MHHLYKATAAFILLAGGCGSSAELDAVLGQQANPAPPPVTTTNLFVQGPAVTGQVAVQTVEGEVLAQGAATAGVASFTLPANLVSGEGAPLVVTFTADSGEHLEAGSGPATFRAVVPNPVADDVVGIDAVSSMIATHHLNHEGLSFEEAARDVFTYLALPPETDPEHLFEDTPFESSLFYGAAREAGGVNALLTQLETEIDGQAGPAARFNSNNSDLPTIFSPLAEKLKGSALDFVSGQIVSAAAGWLQGLIGFPADPTIAQVLDAIDGLRADIQRLSSQIDGVARTQAYITKDQPLAALRAQVSADNDTLAGWASPSNQAKPSQRQLNEKMASIRSTYNSALVAAAQAELPGEGASGAEPGLIALYLEGTVPRLYSATTVDRARYHLRRALDFQQLILNLQVEALHFERPALLYEAEQAIDTYFANAKLQLQQYPLPFDIEHLLLDRGTGLLWTRKPVIIDDWRKIADFVKNYTLGGTPAGQWRLPTASEFDTLVSATGGTGVDQHTEIGMLRDGFQPINGGFEIGEWGIRPLNYLALVGPIDYFSPTLGRATMIHVSNFRRSTKDLNEYVGRFDRIFPYDIAFYLVRNAPTVERIAVTETARTAYTVSYQALAQLSDGSRREVTNLVRWSALNRSGVPVAHDVARISNASDDDGRLTVRVSETQGLKVVAHYKGVEGSLEVPTLRFDPPAITNIVVSPVRYHVPSDAYPFQLSFTARSVRANGQVADANSQVTWSSSDPSVQVSPSGLVTATRPASSKTVDIVAKIGNVVQTSKLVLDP